MKVDKDDSSIETPDGQHFSPSSGKKSTFRHHRRSIRQPPFRHCGPFRSSQFAWDGKTGKTEDNQKSDEKYETFPGWTDHKPQAFFQGSHHLGKPPGPFVRPKRLLHHPGSMFFRLVFIFGVFIALVVGMLTILVNIIRYLMGSYKPIGEPWLIVGIGIMLLFGISMAATQMGRRVYHTVASPLADLMSAAEAVTDGDLSVRVSEDSDGRFSGVVKTFNNMVTALDRADQQRRNLTADVAHELRTPIQIIQGNLEGIMDGVYEPTQQHLKSTLEATQQLSRLVEDLRTLSLAESGQLALSLEPIDLNELLLDTQTTFSSFAEDAGVDLYVAVSDTAPNREGWIIQGDPGRLDQVLANLVVNSVRHTPQGGKITLQADPHPDGIDIRVCDTGEGISDEDLPYIFDRFWRGDRARTYHVGTGSGLGLAITRQLVRLHGGTIDVTSTIGEGTTFILHFPCKPSRA